MGVHLPFKVTITCGDIQERKKIFADVIKLKVLRWVDYLDYSDGP